MFGSPFVLTSWQPVHSGSCCFYPFVFVSLLVWDVAAAPVKPMHDEQGTEDSSRSGLWVWETEGTSVLSAPFRSKITHTHCWNMMKCRKIEMLDDYKQSSCQTNMNELSVIEMSTHTTRLIIIRSFHSCWQRAKKGSFVGAIPDCSILTEFLSILISALTLCLS